MDKIRDEAMKRAAQMQNQQTKNPPVRKGENPKAEQNLAQPQPKSQPEMIQKAEVTDPLSGLFRDKEKLLILLLIMVLSEESTNLELVLALLYIII